MLSCSSLNPVPFSHKLNYPILIIYSFSMGPNIGEAVNFATHDWIAHGSDANERYRSFARPAVFSHDRLTFTMAHHRSEQKSYRNCKLLLKELERVVAEELQLRRKLLMQGVRDVSDLIELPKNRLDQLDEESAHYDDKRLCHACKHVCFFSAVACECSQSKVSCLRHSHYMCRCTPERRYLMIWSSEEELDNTCSAVREHCESLKPEGYVEEKEDEGEQTTELEPLPDLAMGVERDLELHKNEIIPTDPYVPPSRSGAAVEVTTDEDRDENGGDTVGPDDSDEDKKKNDEDYQDEEEGI
jgi:C5HC2 zinc finger